MQQRTKGRMDGPLQKRIVSVSEQRGQMDQTSLSPGSAPCQLGPSPDLSKPALFNHKHNDNDIYSQDCREQSRVVVVAVV